MVIDPNYNNYQGDAYHSFDQGVEDIRMTLTSLSRIPILGIGTSATQVAFGIILAVSAIAIGILSAPGMLFSEDARELCLHSWEHILPDSLINIFGGLLFAIPGIGFCIHYSQPENHIYLEELEERRFEIFTPLDQKVNNFENTLSNISCIPIVGTAAGALKIVFGVAQAVLALALAVLSAPFVYCFQDAEVLLMHSWSYVFHGLANILAGSIEGIPGVGYALSELKEHINEKKGQTYAGELGVKFYPYTSIQSSF